MLEPPIRCSSTRPLMIHIARQWLWPFQRIQLERKHPVTIFLNDRGVLIASKANEEKFKDQQALLLELMNSGASVIACSMCMKHFDVKEVDLLPGIKIGTPESTGAALFQDNTKTMSW